MSRSDSWQARIPWILFVVAAGLYLLTRQRMICGDGIFFDEMLQAGVLMNIHLLQLPLAWSLWTGLSAVVDVSPETAMKILSALAGAAGVAMTYSVGRRLLESSAQALAAALTLMVLVGYWFHSTATELHALHAACASVLLLGLVRALRAGEHGNTSLGKTTLSCCALGALLTPLSHLSGVAMGLPILYALWKVRPPLRWQLLVALAAGSLAFALVFGISYQLSDNVKTSFANSSVAATGWSATGIVAMLEQWLLYAIPVSPLVPAGLAVLFRANPRLAWFSLLWVVAWPLVVSRHTDFLLGSYHAPTFPVQVILATLALRHLARTPLRAVLVMALASAPMVGPMARDAAGLALDNVRETTVLCPAMDDLDLGLCVWVIAATILFGIARGPGPSRPRWLPILPLATLLLSVPYLVPKLTGDPYRDRIREVSRVVGGSDLVLYLPESFSERNHWRRFFRIGNRERGFSPADKEYRPVPLESYRGAIASARQNNLRVWFVGEIDTYSEATRLLRIAPNKEVMAFFTHLRETYRFVRPEGTTEPIYELLSKN
jgi:hypothetical protein